MDPIKCYGKYCRVTARERCSRSPHSSVEVRISVDLFGITSSEVVSCRREPALQRPRFPATVRMGVEEGSSGFLSERMVGLPDGLLEACCRQCGGGLTCAATCRSPETENLRSRSLRDSRACLVLGSSRALRHSASRPGSAPEGRHRRVGVGKFKRFRVRLRLSSTAPGLSLKMNRHRMPPCILRISSRFSDGDSEVRT